MSQYRFDGIIGKSGDLEVFIGFAPSTCLRKISFADVLNEDTGEGYQRPYYRAHSLDFRNYILREGSSTPPLTFNIRSEKKDYWSIERLNQPYAILRIDEETKCLAQIDCQHRLGELEGSDVPLVFMAYIGLSLRQEMAIFNVINSKAKGLSSSLTDFHESKLLNDLATEGPHLYIARKLNDDPRSPWYKLIRYGGKSISGLHRRTSFRMMQKSITKFLSQAKNNDLGDIENKYLIVRSFWIAVRSTFDKEWNDHRHHLITKGIGLYALTRLLGDIARKNDASQLNSEEFIKILWPLRSKVDWSSKGKFSQAGGQKGVQEVYLALKEMLDLESTSCRA